jgi:hypothetical protein
MLRHPHKAARIGVISLGEGFAGLLPCKDSGCANGVLAGSRRVTESSTGMLWLNPSDNQGAIRD